MTAAKADADPHLASLGFFWRCTYYTASVVAPQDGRDDLALGTCLLSPGHDGLMCDILSLHRGLLVCPNVVHVTTNIYLVTDAVPPSTTNKVPDL